LAQVHSMQTICTILLYLFLILDSRRVVQLVLELKFINGLQTYLFHHTSLVIECCHHRLNKMLGVIMHIQQNTLAKEKGKNNKMCIPLFSKNSLLMLFLYCVGFSIRTLIRSRCWGPSRE
jgi:hypothetical protein